jgi:hypothetical protein
VRANLAMRAASPALSAGLLEACDSEELFGVELTPMQRELLASVEADDLLHVWALGRRSGKSLLGALIALWFSLLRPELAELVRRRERRYSVCVATNLRQSRIFVEQARSIVEGSPILSGLVESASDDELRFVNRTVLAAFPCTARGGRGWAVQCLLLDEAAHMLDSDGNQAAAPVYRAMRPSVGQFGPAARVLVASSPFGIDGWFADVFHTVEKGDVAGAVCARHSTLEMRPDLEMAGLEQERLLDPEGYRAEYLAEFVAAGGAFMDASRVAAAVTRDGELPPGEVAEPVAGFDPAFESDSSGLSIVGRDRADRDGLRLVLARSWSPRPGAPLTPSVVLDEVAAICREHRVVEVATDQFSSSMVREHLERRGLRVVVAHTTPQSKSQMFVDLRERTYNGQLELYSQADLLAEVNRIETATTPGAASVRIRRLGSSHGDLATSLALACSRLKPAARGRGYKRGQGLTSGRIDDGGFHGGSLRDRFGPGFPG